MEITLEQLESLLNQQKKIVVDALLLRTASYKLTNEVLVDKIDAEKFIKAGLDTQFPNDVIVLRKYSGGSVKV